MLGIEKLTVEDVEPLELSNENVPDGATASSVGGARVLPKELDTTGLSVDYYRLAPDEIFAVSSH